MNRESLISITKVCSDGDWIESKDQSSDGIRLVQTGNVGNGVYLDKTDRSKFVSEETFSRLRCTEIFPGDVLVSRLPDPIGRACIIPQTNQKMITAVDCTILRFDETKCLPNYFVFFSRSNDYHFQIEQSTFGATRQRVSRKNLEQIKIPLPSLPEQQKIAAHLDSIQSAIDNKKQQLQQLDELVKSKFVEMFGENPVESGKWKVEKLSSICKVQTGGTPSRMHPEYFEGNIPWITTANLGVNELNYDDAMEYITQEAVDNSATKIIPAHSLFIGIRVGVGKCSINNVDMCSNQDICGLSGFDVARTNLLFVKKVIDSYEDYFDNAKRGTTIKGVKSDTIKELKIFLPELELQTTFAEYVQKIDSAKSIIKTQLVDLQELLDSKMDEYFGE